MSAPVTLAMRQELAAAFAAELGGRVYDLSSPPEAVLPLATYRLLDSDEAVASHRAARIQVTLRHEEYAPLKRLQQRVMAHFGGLTREWMGAAGEAECPVWVHSVDARAGGDGFQQGTRHRFAVVELTVRYADVVYVAV